MKKNSLTAQLDPLVKKIEELDKVQRLLICIGTIICVLALYYYFLAKPTVEKIKSNRAQYKTTEQQLGVAKKKAAELPKLIKQREMKKAEFRKAMRALPEKKEIPALLTSISQVGQATSVAFSSFTPVSENVLEFYAEIPVQIEMTGNYHNTIKFFDQVTSMNRIVNIKDVKMKKDSKTENIITSCKAVTYKFVEQKEVDKKKKRKRR